MKKTYFALISILFCISLISCNRVNTPTPDTDSAQPADRQGRPTEENRVVGPIVSDDREMQAYIHVDYIRGMACSVVSGQYGKSVECESISRDQMLGRPRLIGPTSSSDGHVRVYTLIAPGIDIICAITEGQYVPAQDCMPMRQQEQEEE